MSGLIVCHGPDKGDSKAFKCSCCGYESSDPEAFAMSTCWPCSGIGGGNLDCARCVSFGVWVDRFSTKNSKGHRMVSWTGSRRHVVTACGLRIARADIGQGTAVRKPCARCWPDEDER